MYRGLNEYLPLKQGLRLPVVGFIHLSCLNEYLPLKQGLRLFKSASIRFISSTSMSIFH